MTSLKIKSQNYWSSWDFTFMMYKIRWKLLFTQIFAPNGFLIFLIDFSWISKLLRDVAFTWRPRELSCWFKKVTYFGKFGNLNSSCIRKSIILMFLSSRRVIYSRFCSKTQWQMFLLVSGRHVGAHPDGHQHGVSIQIYINLGKKFSCLRKIAVTQILGRDLARLPSFFSRTVLIFILTYF